MKYNCEIVRDLLPLYVDGIASSPSKSMVEEHIFECKDCAELLSKMKEKELESEINAEKVSVISAQRRFFKRKSAIVGGIISAIFMIPILVCLIVNLATGASLTWFFIVLASLLTAVSLTVVPLMVPENKLAWTLGTFSVTLVLLMGVCCLYTGGRWFFVASSASLFGLCLVFMPFLKVIKHRRALICMVADTLLFFLMMLSIGLYVDIPYFFAVSSIISVPIIVFAWIVFVIIVLIGKIKRSK